MEDPCSSARIQEYWSGPRCYFGEAHLEFSGLGRIALRSDPKSGLVSGRGGPLGNPGGHFLVKCFVSVFSTLRPFLRSNCSYPELSGEIRVGSVWTTLGVISKRTPFSVAPVYAIKPMRSHSTPTGGILNKKFLERYVINSMSFLIAGGCRPCGRRG